MRNINTSSDRIASRPQPTLAVPSRTPRTVQVHERVMVTDVSVVETPDVQETTVITTYLDTITTTTSPTPLPAVPATSAAPVIPKKPQPRPSLSKEIVHVEQSKSQRPALDSSPVVRAKIATPQSTAQQEERLTERPVRSPRLTDQLSQTEHKPSGGSGEQPLKKTLWTRLKNRRLVSGVALTLLLAVTGYVSIDTWLTNNRVKQELSALATDAPGNRQAAEGRDETEVSASVIDNYKVASDMPRLIMIDKLNLKARLMQMGVNADGSMQAPINIFDAGWYTGSAKPGEAGAMLVDAHASGPTREGLFAYLDTLKKDDIITIERGDGTKFRYRVVHTETVPLAKVDMNTVLTPHGNVKEGLNLITCTGSWLEDKRTYDHRAIVYTERINDN